MDGIRRAHLAHMVDMEMGEHHIINLSSGRGREEMLDIGTESLICGGRRVRALRLSGRIGRENLPRIDNHSRPVRKDIESTFSASGIDKMDVQITFAPSGHYLSTRSIRLLHGLLCPLVILRLGFFIMRAGNNQKGGKAKVFEYGFVHIFSYRSAVNITFLRNITAYFF